MQFNKIKHVQLHCCFIDFSHSIAVQEAVVWCGGRYG